MKVETTKHLDNFWLLEFQRKDHDQQFSKLSFFQRMIGRWLRFDFWLVETLSDYWDSNARILINTFQIFHSFSEEMVAGWVSTGELRPFVFDRNELQYPANSFLLAVTGFFGQWGCQGKEELRWCRVRLIFHKQGAAKVGLDGRIQLKGFCEKWVSNCLSVLRKGFFQ